MVEITVRDIDLSLEQAIDLADSLSGVSVEEEIHETLSRAYGSGGRLLDALADIRTLTGGVELDIPARMDLGRTPEFRE